MKKIVDVICIGAPFLLSQVILYVFSYLCLIPIQLLSSAGLLPADMELMYELANLVYVILGPVLVIVLCRLIFGSALPYGPYGPAGKRFRASSATVVVLLLLGLLCQYVLSIVLTVFSQVFVEVFQAYLQRLEEIGMTNPTVSSLISGILIAPIYEEFLFRGFTRRIAEKIFSFPVANALQALLFAAAHMDLVQGIYAFLLGLVLGWIAHRYASLKPGILLHFFINLSGFFLVPGSMGAVLLLTAVVALALRAALRRQKAEDPQQYLFRPLT